MNRSTRRNKSWKKTFGLYTVLCLGLLWFFQTNLYAATCYQIADYRFDGTANDSLGISEPFDLLNTTIVKTHYT